MDRRSFMEAMLASIALSRFGSSQEIAKGAVVTHAELANLSRSATPLPVPSSVIGVSKPVINLNGQWKFAPNPSADFFQVSADLSGWKDVEMPNEFTVLGFTIAKDVEYPVRKSISIPADFAEHTIVLRFDGVYGYARVWVNGKFVRDHFGGFTAWDCDITSFVQAGPTAEIVVGVTDRSDDISQASYYAKHEIGGILRDVRLIALPQNHVRHLNLNASLDAHYKNGVLDIAAVLSSKPSGKIELHLRLLSPTGKRIALHKEVIAGDSSDVVGANGIIVPDPLKWDSEHPNLYKLEIDFVEDGKRLETFERHIGFRTVERRKNQLLVNGQPVKLRGVCRHSIHPVTGRVVSPQLDEKDAELLRAANINFVRTSHYPPTEYFLDACDRHGIYVEEETAVCWSEREGGDQSGDPVFTERFVSQFQEMVCRDHSHASVLFWSLGNESKWGSNFGAELHFAREYDSRPLIFSYPNTGSLELDEYDIYSKHYADVNAELGSPIYPVLHDEFAHIPCYNTSSLVLDPGVRNFWGESIKRFGDEFLISEGCLGGSIWAGIDEVFLLPDNITGYGPWGIVDGWRREKPEYWHTKKAYSPIRIEDRPVPNPGSGNILQIPIKNAFDHTNLQEIRIHWSVGNASGELSNVNIAPHASGYLRIPARNWEACDVVKLKFRSTDGKLIDCFQIPIERWERPDRKIPQGTVQLTQDANTITISGENFVLTIQRATGLIKEGVWKGDVVLEGGPYLNLGKGRSAYWSAQHCHASMRDGFAVVRVRGEAKFGEGFLTTPFEYELEIAGNGVITTRYRTDAKPSTLNHLGISFLLPKDIDRLWWDRKALWSYYPEDHIGRAKGTALRNAAHPQLAYKDEPKWPWSADMHDFFLQGHGQSASATTNDFRSLKEHVWAAACLANNHNACVCVESNAEVAVQASAEVDRRIVFSMFNFWRFPDLEWGNYLGVSGPPAVSEYEVVIRMMDRLGI